MPIPDIIRINSAEAMIDHFFDPELSSLAVYSVEDPTCSGARPEQFWCGVKLVLPAGSDGPQLIIRRTCDIDLSGCDRFTLRASLPAATSVTVCLTIDGSTQRVIDREPGIDDFVEYEGTISGNRLLEIEIRIERADGVTTVGNLEWTMIADSKARDKLRRGRQAFDSRWEGYLKPEAESDQQAVPDIGFVISAEEVERLRRKLHRPPWDRLYEQIRAYAEVHRDDRPEEWIGAVNQALTSRYARNVDYPGPGVYATSAEEARALAFVGLIENDRGLLRTAARIALSHAMCGEWKGWLDTHPVSTWEHRAFQQYRVAVACSLVLDWAGSVLTDYGKEVITCAIAEKGLADIQTTCMRHDYVRGNNQGLFFAWGWIVSVLAIEKRWPNAIEWLEQPKEILIETINRYVLPDGGADEGIGYLTGSLNQGLEGLALYARRTGTDPIALIPDQVREVPAFVAANLSSVPPDGSVVPIADGGRVGTPPYRLTLVQLADLYHDETAASLYSFLLNWPISENASDPGAVFELIHGPEDLPEAALPIPSFARFPESGMMSSFRTDGDRSVRLFLTGGKADGGHSHDDRGSLIVEIDRQNVLVDGSQLVYSDPQAEIMKYALFHNLVTPGAIEETGVRQINPCPVSTVVTGSGDANRLDCSIDVSGAWAAPVTGASRRVKADCIEVFTIEDTMDLESPGPVTFRCNALQPFEAAGPGWRLLGTGFEFRIEPAWEVARSSIEQIGVDGAKRPLFQLMLEAPDSKSHRLITTCKTIWRTSS